MAIYVKNIFHIYIISFVLVSKHDSYQML